MNKLRKQGGLMLKQILLRWQWRREIKEKYNIPKGYESVTYFRQFWAALGSIVVIFVVLPVTDSKIFEAPARSIRKIIGTLTNRPSND